MSRSATVWWNKQKCAWCTDIGGRRQVLAKGRSNRKAAVTKLKSLVQEQELLAEVNGAISVARLCEEFLADAKQHLELSTYESYQYGCQKFVNLFGPRLAHTIEPLDVNRFSIALKVTLNDSSRGIVLRSVLRCFNWGVEMRLIPPHRLATIRKPQARERDRFLSDDEFRQLLRATNAENGSRSGAVFRRFLFAMEWTFCRPGEVSRLKWENIRWEQNVALLPHHKTKRIGKPKIIPLIPRMTRLLKWLQKRSKSDFCFVNSKKEPWTRGALEKRMETLREKTGLKDVVPYTMRHRAATNSIIRTGDLKMTSMMLGHNSTRTTERYTHVAQEHLVNFAKKATG
jgi:integrase